MVTKTACATVLLVLSAAACAWGQATTALAAPKADANTATAVLIVRHDSPRLGENYADGPEIVAALLTSRRMARKIGNDMKIFNDGPNAFQEFINGFRSNLRVEVLSRSDRMTMVQLSYRTDDPAKAADMVNRVVDAFKEMREEYHTTAVDRAVRVLTERCQDIERKLAECMRMLTTFEQDRPAMLVDDPGTIRARYQQILADIETYRRREAAAKTLIAKLEPLKKSPGVEVEIARAQAEQETAAKELENLEKRRAAELDAAKTFAQDLRRRDALAKQLDALTAIREELARECEKVKTDYEMSQASIEVVQKAEPPAAPAK